MKEISTQAAAKRRTVEERVTEDLQCIFAQNGYARYEMSSFESYDLYIKHKGFLNTAGIITFSDAHGKLKALKPDVTMSIVKNTKAQSVQSKLYYIESVFRTPSHGGDIREIKQMGVEFIGCEDAYQEAETIKLAVQSLEAISADYVLDISHMGFVTGILNAAVKDEQTQQKMREALRAKNAHTLLEIAEQAGCDSAAKNMLKELITLSGDFESTLKRAKALALCDEARAAADVLQNIYSVLFAVGKHKNLRLDFSVSSDVDYYNGIVMHGYVKNVPSAVLSGGRYDNLMRCFDKPQGAFGFAVYLGELGRAFAKTEEFDVDVLLLYKNSDAPQQIAAAVDALQKQGKSVYAAPSDKIPQNLNAKQTQALS